MVNRIQQIIKSKGLSPSFLADKIEVQRSSISHILSGRNKPSLDIVMKILTTFGDVNSDWLLFGKGQMFTSNSLEEVNVKSETIKSKTVDNKNDQPLQRTLVSKIIEKEVDIEKIVVFYKDQSFREYSPR